MHELALAESVLAIVDETARRHGADRVRTVRVRIGALACVEADALRFCFDAVTRGSVAERADLEIDACPGEAWCMRCGDAVPIAARGDACPRCGGYQLEVTRGDEMRVMDIVIAQGARSTIEE
jgi:hydrogenase nickel incorporation protein HypA/HybF